MSFSSKFSNLGQPNKIWVISAIHGDAARLHTLHKTLFNKVKPGDRLVYTGNYMSGVSTPQPAETFNEMILFRRVLLARPGMKAKDFVYLRGIQEELWRQLLQIQFKLGPQKIIEDMQEQHPYMDAALRDYGSSMEEALRIAKEGIPALIKWTSKLKFAIRDKPGHEELFLTMRRAAFTELRHTNDNNTLFVHAGLNPELPLLSQGQNFWSGSKDFNEIKERYRPFKSVVRGFDPDNKGLHVGSATVSLGGDRLLCAEMTGTGDVLKVLAA